jgi:hypothetical protein
MIDEQDHPGLLNSAADAPSISLYRTSGPAVKASQIKLSRKYPFVSQKANLANFSQSQAALAVARADDHTSPR